MAKITYVGPYPEVAVPTPTGDVIVAHGETVDLPDDLVHGVPAEGEPPSLNNGFSSPGYRTGIGGLVDQPANWQLPKSPKKTAQKTTTTAPDTTKES